jgi:DNA-directed RNA polymerase specialized sigma24 family protein
MSGNDKGTTAAALESFAARTEWNDAELEALVGRVIEGDERAWQALWLALDPEIERIARRGRVTGQLSRRYDERRDIVLLVMEELRRDDFAVLRDLHQALQRRDGSFRANLFTIAKHLAIDYTRAHAEFRPMKGGSAWAVHVEVPAGLQAGGADPIDAVTMDAVLEFAVRELRPAQLQALLLWTTGEGMEDIAAKLRLATPAEAQHLVQSAKKRLRRRFAPATEAGEEPERKSSEAGLRSGRKLA